MKRRRGQDARAAARGPSRPGAGDPRLARGRAAEAAAAAFLERAGYEIVARNVWLCGAELDLVARDGDTLAFVEIRSRSHRRFGGPLETIGPVKRQRIARAAQAFLARYAPYGAAARFDVVGVDWRDGRPVCSLIRGAFDTPT